MTNEERVIFEDLAARGEEMLDLLERLVSIDSKSGDKAGVDAVSGTIADYLRSAGVTVEVVPNAIYGDGVRALVARPGTTNRPPVVLMGHCDTVFPRGEVAKRPFRVENGRAYGPGVADMKGGLAMNAVTLAALARAGAAASPVIGLFTVDEEIASPWSRTVITETCAGARAVFNAEPARPTGNIVTGRNGGVFFRVEIKGTAAHSGVNFTSGVSAVGEAARKIVAIEDITDLARGVTANAGVVGGGTAFNIVAPQAFFEAEVRYRYGADRERVRGKIEEIVARAFVEGSKSELIVHGEFPPMERTDDNLDLLDAYIQAAAEAGFAPGDEFSGGCSDAGFAARLGVPTLCAVGPVGGKQHTDEEFLELASLVPRAQAIAVCVLRAAQY